MKKFDVIVVGGGLVGYTFAIDLAIRKSKFNIAVIEAKEFMIGTEDSLDNRIYAVAPDNITYLENLGLNISTLRHGTIDKMDVSGDINSNIILDKNITHNQFLAKTFEYKILQQELYNKIIALDNVTLIYDNIQDIEKNEIVTILGEKSSYVARLIVGADGANSFVRKVSKIDAKLIDYNQSGVVANFAGEIPHNNIAYQWFNNGEVLAYLPLPNNHISIVWSSKNPNALLNMPSEEFVALVSQAGYYKLGNLKLVTKPVAFPLRMYLLDKIYSEKIVLIGDAAHTIHPLAGQGVNLGFRDAKTLVNVLSNVENYQLGEIGILAKYNIVRQTSVKEMQLTCHALHQVFSSENEIIKLIRNKGMNFVNKLPLMKRVLMSSAN